MWRRRKKREWNPNIEGLEFEHETMSEEMSSLVPNQIRSRAYAAASILGMISNDISAENAYAQRCPQCDRHQLVRERPGDPKSPWKCTHCGNDADEFGNKL